MTRKDSEKEAERPHYYSQFWLDVAAGRKVIGGGLKTDEAETDTELDTIEPELEPEPEPIRRSGRSTSPVASTQEEATYAAPMAEAEAEPEFAVEEFAEPEPEFALEEEEFDQDQELPNILVEEEEVPDMDLVDEDEEDFFDEEDVDEEEEEDEGWGRGRKKPKPGRQAKLPPKPPAKKPRRDRRY